MGLLEGGYCKTIVIFRSMNGRSGRRMGGQAQRSRAANPSRRRSTVLYALGLDDPGAMVRMSAMRYLRDTGATTKTFAEVAVAHRYHASLNPKAIMRAPITIEDHQRSRWVSKPLRLLDCCLETDVSAAIIITSRERAFDMKQPPVFIMGGTARTMAPSPSWNYSRPEIHYVAGNYGRNRLFGMAGISQKVR